jgi:outer membrane receptor protein involved in Fe transport
MRDSVRTSSSALIAAAGLLAAPATAQESAPGLEQDKQNESAAAGEEIVVTGSYIRRTEDQIGSPVLTIDRDLLERQGLSAPSDLLRTLPENFGSELNSDVQGQGGTLGTANVNLRGLGLNSTLVLLNGRRQTEYAINNANGDTFVDVNTLMPLIAIERVEVLKDGASALYGSDAIAGVVNFITRRRFSGFRIAADYRTVTEASQADAQFEGLLGIRSARGGVLLAASYTERTSLLSSERRSITAGSGISTLGQPGSFQPVFYPIVNGRPNFNAPPQPSGPPLADPLCGDPRVGGLPGAGPSGACGIDVSDFNTLVPEENRFVVYGQADYELSDGVRIRFEGTYADTEASSITSSGFPILQFPIIPANNPGNTFVYPRAFGPPGSGQFTGNRAPTRFFGRAFGVFSPPQDITTSHELYRLVAAAEVELGSGWVLNADSAYSDSSALGERDDLKRNEFIAALNGRGGPQGNLFFNPFANAALAAPGDPRFNSPEVLDFIRTRITNRAERTLWSSQVVVSGNPLRFGAGPLGIAAGLHHRRETISSDFDEVTNADNLLFFLGDPDFSGSRNVSAAFAELRAEPLSGLDIQLAGRYERYEGGTSTFDPKASFIWRAAKGLTFRGSAGTSFRAPSLFQIFGFRTSVAGVVDPRTPNQGVLFRPIRTTPNPELQPEEAKTYSLGVALDPVPWLVAKAGYWRTEYTDRIVRRSPQGILLANPADPRVLRDPATGEIQRIDAEFFNAASVTTDGLDFELEANRETSDAGTFRLNANLSWLLNYEIRETSGGPVIDALGRRNETNSGFPAPRLRGFATLGWSLDRFSADGTLRYTGKLVDDAPGGSTLDALTTVDLQLSWRFPSVRPSGDAFRLSLGAQNIFNKLPPRAVSTLGYEPRLYDPRVDWFMCELRWASNPLDPGRSGA